MGKTKVRITKVELINIKNVENGSVNLNNVDDDTPGASVVGIYGQNGSGKTALIWAMELIKDALSGVSLPKDTYFYIRQNSEVATIKVNFLINLEQRNYDLFYTISLAKQEDEKVQIVFESVDYSAKAYEKLQKINKTRILGIEYPLASNEIDKCFYIPESRIVEMTAQDKQVRSKLTVLQALSNERCTSFIFNEKVMKLLKDAFDNPVFYKLLNNLFFYGRMNLFVLNRNAESSLTMSFLPLSMRLSSENTISKSDGVPVLLGKNELSKEMFEIVKTIVSQIDVLIGSIIPGLNIEIIKQSTQLDKNAEEKIVFELASNRNGVITPLRYESEGIKKIICILSSLIAMYNDSSVFVAIDEMDAGVFEYLLGEILDTISKTGKGQLLFTSHNMRPLEVLGKNNIYFTTTNPKNKYIQFTGIKESNNLRTTLLRTIDLGGQKESVYESTSAYQIGKAFRKAGGVCQ